MLKHVKVRKIYGYEMEENMKWVCESEILISGGYESESRRWKKDEEGFDSRRRLRREGG